MNFSQPETLQILFENALDAVVGMDANGFVSDWNAQAQATFGWTKDEAMGKRMSELIIPEKYRAMHEAGLKKYIAMGIGPVLNKRLELVGLKRDGVEIPIELTVTPIRVDDRLKFYAFIRDITERKKASRGLLEAKEMAEAANRAKSDFLANMSHEIRTPLGAVLGFSELISEENISDEERARYMSAIRRNGELLSKVINDILDFSKVEAQKIEIDPREIFLNDVVSDLDSLLSLQAKEKGIDYELNVATDAPLVLRTDVVRLRQILFNVVGNAIKFTVKGRIEVRIEKDGDKNISFFVRDSGVGIPEEQREKLFQSFMQADTSMTRRFGGTGLGLVISKNLAQLLGGDVTLVSSEVGKGSVFQVSIAANVDGVPLSHLSMPAGKHPSADLLKGSNVLVVDDSEDNLIFVSVVLKKMGVHVVTAADGQEAIDKIHKKKFDVVLMDLQMPVLDGFETVSRLRKEGQKVPIVALTAHSLKSDYDRCLASGFDGHLAKPVQRENLVNTLLQFID